MSRLPRTASVLRGLVAAGLAVVIAAGSAPSPSAAAVPTTSPVEQNRRLALELNGLPFSDVDLGAVQALVAPSMIQHDARIGSGPAALSSWIATYRSQYPQASISVKRVIADNDLVMIYSNVIDVPGTRGSTSGDYYRIAGGRIVEHWNALEAAPESITSGHDLYSTVSTPQLPGVLPDRRADETQTRAVLNSMLTNGTVDSLRKDGGSPYYQHTTAPVTDGTASILDLFETEYPDLAQTDYRWVAEGDYFSLLSEWVFRPEWPKINIVGVFRVRDGKMVEHWESVMPESVVPANDNGWF